MIFEFDLEQDDRSLLRTFFEQLRKGFAQVIEVGYWARAVPVRFVGEGQRLLQGALAETREEWPRIEAAIDEVGDATLRRFGLLGQSLRAKLYFIGFWSARVREMVQMTDWFDLWDAIRRVLENLNIVLESFYQATGAGELLKELKDVILHNMTPVDSDFDSDFA